MRASYYEQLRRSLEPDAISIHSKTKSITANSQPGAAPARPNGVAKSKQEQFRNHHARDSVVSFDASVLD